MPIEQTTKMEAKREEWDRSAHQLQQMHEGVLAAHAKLQGQPQIENSRLQQQLREAQLGELRCQQQIGAARVTAENTKRQQKELETKLKALQDESNVMSLRHSSASHFQRIVLV
ncbi:hypothetical protein KRP22_013922 [Phytophthora ramorum]|nr:hypothetical protein KRP22_13750 [Phytophthora ramorum]